MVENATEAKQEFGPCSCQDSGKCKYIDGSPACMAQASCPDPTPEALWQAFFKDQETVNIYSMSPEELNAGLLNVYFMGMEDA